jgi:Uma2 family endonuclease
MRTLRNKDAIDSELCCSRWEDYNAFMGVASQFVTLADYLKMEFPEGVRDELIKGEVVISPAAKPNHQLVTMQLLLLLNEAVDKTKFLVNYDTSIVVEQSDPASMPRPDVFVMDGARFRTAAAEDRYPEGSPELSIEVVSPSNSKKELENKINLYLAGGSLAVWIVYPKKRTVVLWEAGGKSSEFREGDALLPSLLSNRTIQVADIFSVLD